jgi:hypothetical protein
MVAATSEAKLALKRIGLKSPDYSGVKKELSGCLRPRNACGARLAAFRRTAGRRTEPERLPARRV